MEAKRINPDKKVVCVTWDWWFLMNLWDLETAVRLKIDLVIIIINDSSYWMIKWKQKKSWFENYWLWFKNPDFIKLAESFGAKWYKVKNKNDFSKILKNSLNNKWINLIDLDFEYPDKIK
jgi:acetolactate synthase-1/2/3 large subunit